MVMSFLAFEFSVIMPTSYYSKFIQQKYGYPYFLKDLVFHFFGCVTASIDSFIFILPIILCVL